MAKKNTIRKQVENKIRSKELTKERKQMNKRIGNEYRKQREKAGVTLQFIATKLGVTRQAVSYWELGDMRPSDENKEKLLQLFTELNGPHTLT